MDRGGSEMAYQVRDNDYLHLLEYFEERADSIKEAMFNSVTWAVGFAAAILGFIFTNLMAFDPQPSFKSLTGVLGASVVYAAVLVLESRRHILVNWDRAKLCREQVRGLDRIWLVSRNGPWLMVWTQIGIVIFVFAIGFAALFAWALSRT
jgi:hypothetical protein